MRFENQSVVFEWAEVQRLLPETLALNGYRLSELLGGNSYEVRMGDAKIVIEATPDVRIRVVSDRLYLLDTLSSLVAECERIISQATETGIFHDLETALKVAELLRPYFERIAQQVTERTTYELRQQIKLLETKLQELQQKQK